MRAVEMANGVPRVLCVRWTGVRGDDVVCGIWEREEERTTSTESNLFLHSVFPAVHVLHRMSVVVVVVVVVERCLAGVCDVRVGRQMIIRFVAEIRKKRKFEAAAARHGFGITQPNKLTLSHMTAKRAFSVDFLFCFVFVVFGSQQGLQQRMEDTSYEKDTKCR